VVLCTASFSLISSEINRKMDQSTPEHLNNLFTVVHFPLDNSVEAVPSKWISEDLKVCPWPKRKSASFDKVIRDPISTPGTDWELYEIRIIKRYGKFDFIISIHPHSIKRANDSSELKLAVYVFYIRFVPKSPQEG
jgi:hypothetical protein